MYIGARTVGDIFAMEAQAWLFEVLAAWTSAMSVLLTFWMFCFPVHMKRSDIEQGELWWTGVFLPSAHAPMLLMVIVVFVLFLWRTVLSHQLGESTSLLDITLFVLHASSPVMLWGDTWRKKGRNRFVAERKPSLVSFEAKDIR
jgi:hypothetical protein